MPGAPSVEPQDGPYHWRLYLSSKLVSPDSDESETSEFSVFPGSIRRRPVTPQNPLYSLTRMNRGIEKMTLEEMNIM